MRARVTWSSGRTEILDVIRETEKTFTTDDVNQSRWWKRNGMRVGYISNTTNLSKISPAFASIVALPLIDVT